MDTNAKETLKDFKRAAEKLRMWMSRTLEQMNVSSRKE